MAVDLSAATARYNQLLGQRETLRAQLVVRTEARDEEARLTTQYSQAALLLGDLGERLQAASVGGVEHLVTLGLRSVFGGDLTFRAIPQIRNKVVTYDFRIEEPSGLVTDLEGARGGGLVALCGVILRLVTLRLLGDRMRQLLVLDEPFAHLSEGYVPAAAELVRSLARDLGVQVIMVTHQSEFADSADVVYELAKTSTGTVAKEVKRA